MLNKRFNSVRTAKLTYRQRVKAQVKNVPQTNRPSEPDIVFVYEDEEVFLDGLFKYPMKDNDELHFEKTD